MVSSSRLSLASTISRWKPSLCSITPWTSLRAAASRHPVDLGLERRDVVAQARRGQPRRELLERGAHVVELEHAPLPRVADVGAAVRLAAHEAEHLELAQRLAHGPLARPVLPGDVHLDEAVARPVLALQDGPHDAVPDVVAQRPTRLVHRNNVLRTGLRKREMSALARPVTLFTGQWADLPLAELAEQAGAWGFDGLELACWGDHFDVAAALSDPGYCRGRRELLERHGLGVLGDRQPPRRPGGVRPDRRAPPGRAAARGLGRRRARGRAAAAPPSG